MNLAALALLLATAPQDAEPGLVAEYFALDARPETWPALPATTMWRHRFFNGERTPPRQFEPLTNTNDALTLNGSERPFSELVTS